MHRRCAGAPHRLATLAATTLVASVVAAAPAAAVPPEQVDAAVESGAAWIRAQQDPATGELPGFGGDWALTALAAAGIDAAQVKAPGGPSAQDFYLAAWTSSAPEPWLNWTAPSGGPDGRPATDYERAILLAHAAGLQPSRLSAEQNLIAQLAGIYNGRPETPDPAGSGPTEGTFGTAALFNGTMFGALALAATEVPQAVKDKVTLAVRGNQHDDGGWTFQRVTNAASRARPSDIDMTGAGLAALCGAGVAPTDPGVQRAVAFLQSKVDPVSGGFTHMFGSNSDSASWAVQGLNVCGIDPQGAGWAPAGKGPIDFLISLQRTSGPLAGSVKYTASEPDDGPANLYSTQAAVRALAGAGFTADPPAVRAAPAVADGTVVPQALAVGAGDDVRFCRVYAPVGATVLALLEAAPAGCVDGLVAGEGQVLTLNGVTADTPERRWLARVDGSEPALAGPEPVGLGDVVALELGPDPSPVPDPDPDPLPSQPPASPPAAGEIATPPPAAAAATLSGRRRQRGGRVAVRVSCPAASAGCGVTLIARATFRGKARRVGSLAVTLAAGESRTVRLRLSAALRRDLARHTARSIRLRARTRTAEGATLVHRMTVRATVA